MEKIYDCIILGSGPASLSCALYLLRANKEILIFEKNNVMNKVSSIDLIDNYLGFKNISGKELANKMLDHVLSYNKDLIINYNVQQIYLENNLFVLTDYNSTYKTKNLVLAIGLQTKEIIPNVDNYIGKGVSYCISCDGFLYKNKKVVLIGQKDKLKEMNNEFKNLTNDIVSIETGQLKQPEILGDFKVEGIRNNNEIIECDGIFIDPLYSNINIPFDIKKSGNYIVVDKNNMTNIDKLYAIGDIVDKPLRQICTAISDGAIAATSIIRSQN